MLGIHGLMRAYRAENRHSLMPSASASPTIHAYMPRMVRYYLAQEPILPNVETHICREPSELRYTLDNLAELAVKPAGTA